MQAIIVPRLRNYSVSGVPQPHATRMLAASSAAPMITTPRVIRASCHGAPVSPDAAIGMKTQRLPARTEERTSNVAKPQSGITQSGIR
jgi:hypothetical protein